MASIMLRGSMTTCTASFVAAQRASHLALHFSTRRMKDSPSDVGGPVMPALNDGHDALRSSGPGNIPTRDAAQSLDSSNPGAIVKVELNVVDASAVNSVPSRGHTARGEDVVVHVAEAAASGPVTYSAIARQFIWLGWLAFGGPSAHIALFQKVFVERLRWISATLFLEFLALSQCLPGPTSTQVSFVLGVVSKGVSGGLISGTLFQYPGFLIASLAGAGAASFLRNPAPWLHGLLSGLSAVGVALVASAAVSLTYGTCKDRVTMAINAVAALISFYYPKTWIFPTLILAGGLVTLYTQRKKVSSPSHADLMVKLGVNKAVGLILVFLWMAVLVVTIVLRRHTSYEAHKELHWWEGFYRTGSIIFGGGQVVLPLLQNEVVATGWVSEQDFLTGFALVQAMPGPLFNFAAYLGAVIAYNAGVNRAIGIFTCWIALFSPGIMLIYGVMPWWGVFRSFQIYRRMLPGLNSAAVGLIVGAVFSLTFQIYKNSPFPTTSICIGIIGYALVDCVRCPAPLAVLVGGVCGVIGWAAHMY